MKTAMNPKKLVTHNGSFHSDDIFAAATLSLYLESKGENFEIIRTRDEELINSGDYVFDVGGVYDPDKNLFDHHQKGGAGKRENGIEYASFGLVWKKFGSIFCDHNELVANLLDSRLVAPIDANDNGQTLSEIRGEISPYLIQDFFRAMRPTWNEDMMGEDKAFLKCIFFAKEILVREITWAKDSLEAEKKILSIYEHTRDKRILVFDKDYMSANVLENLKEILYVIYPRHSDNSWGVKSVRNDVNSFKNRKDLPKAWGGLKDKELQNITGVSDAIFCHRALFMAVAKSKEGAIKLAQIAVSL